MLARCTAKRPNEKQIKSLGEYYEKHGAKHDSHLTVGKTYLVLGLVFNVGRGRMATGASLTLLCDHGHVESYPVVLFDILDPRVDPEWIMRSRIDGIVEICPEVLIRPHFAEDYLDGVPEAVRPFRELLRRMEQRTASSNSSVGQ